MHDMSMHTCDAFETEIAVPRSVDGSTRALSSAKIDPTSSFQKVSFASSNTKHLTCIGLRCGANTMLSKLDDTPTHAVQQHTFVRRRRSIELQCWLRTVVGGEPFRSLSDQQM